MATFKALIKRGNKRSDGTWNVVIRFTHKSKIRFIPTAMYVGKKDITTSYKIKNAQIIEHCDEIIRRYRIRVNELNLEFNDIDIDTITEYITKKSDNSGISFTDFANRWLSAKSKGRSNYITALNAYKSFMGRDNILCSEVTLKSMKGFEESLSDRPRAQSIYPIYVKVIFNAARDYYNDEDNGIIRIKHSLDRYKPVPQNIAVKRALDVDIIRRIFALPCIEGKKGNRMSRRNMALDCFKMSFCLLGINTADLYNATELDGDTLVYQRTKTKDRRADHAEIHVKIPPYIKDIVSKYRDNERVFVFHRHYANMKAFNKAVNIGLKSIGNELGIDNLEYYAARHSMATIAVNDVGISKYVVNDMLNHTDPSLKVTELYIKKDFKTINVANMEVLDFVLCKD
jgi:integrase